MRTVSVADAKARLSEILNEVIAGEEIIITQRGLPIAKIASIKKQLKPLPNMSQFRANFPKSKVSSKKMLKQLREEGY